MRKWKLLLLMLSSLAIFYQVTVTLRNAFPPLLETWKAIGKSAVWRGVNFSTGQEFAYYVEFLEQWIPLQSKVVIPPDGARPEAMSRTPYMQFFLAPRQVINCNEDGNSVAIENCAAGLSASGVYLLVNQRSQFPGQDFLDTAQSTPNGPQLRMFNQDLGVLLPGDAQVQPVASFDNSSLFQIASRLFWPALWLSVLTVAGWPIVHRLAPGLSLISQVGLGFGLGVGSYSFLLYIALLAGVALSPGLVIGLTLVCLVAGLAIFPWRNLRRPLSEVAAGPLVIDRRALVYLVVFSAFALIAAALAVGQAYHWSDEVVLWGIKGYGISDLGLSAGVSEWGTRTTSYPLHLPLMIASFRAVFGDVMPESKILFPLYFLSLMVLVFDFLRQRLNVHLAAGLTLLYGASPLIFFHARLAYANLPLTFYLTSAAILLDGALRSRHSGKQGFNPDRHSLFLSGIFFTLAAWTRPEGLVMSAATLLLASIMLVWRAKPSSKPTQPLSAILSLCGPFLIYLIVWSFSSPLVYQQPGWSGAAFLVGLEKIVGNQINLESTAFVLKSFFDIRLQLEAWGLLVFSIISLVAFVPFFFYKQHTASLLAGIGLLYLLVVLGMYILLANDPASNPSWWVDTGLSRMLMPGLTLLWLGLIDWAAMVSQARPSNDLQQPASG